MGTSVDDGARKSNNWLDQWESSKLSTGSRVQSFPRAFPSSTDVPVLLLNQPNVSVRGFTEDSLVSRVDGIPDGRPIHVKNKSKCAFKNIRICMDRAFHDSANLKRRQESVRFFRFIYVQKP